MSPPPSLLSDLTRLLGFLLAPRCPATLTDRERLEVAALQARLILRRCATGVYRGERRRRPEPSEN
jgi:hypothetical protein